MTKLLLFVFILISIELLIIAAEKNKNCGQLKKAARKCCTNQPKFISSDVIDTCKDLKRKKKVRFSQQSFSGNNKGNAYNKDTSALREALDYRRAKQNNLNIIDDNLDGYMMDCIARTQNWYTGTSGQETIDERVVNELQNKITERGWNIAREFIVPCREAANKEAIDKMVYNPRGLILIRCIRQQCYKNCPSVFKNQSSTCENTLKSVQKCNGFMANKANSKIDSKRTNNFNSGGGVGKTNNIRPTIKIYKFDKPATVVYEFTRSSEGTTLSPTNVELADFGNEEGDETVGSDEFDDDDDDSDTSGGGDDDEDDKD